MSLIAELAGVIEKVSGHRFEERELDRLTRVAEERARVCGRTNLAEYVRWLCGDRTDPEWRRLLSRVTISESYLFRAPQQLRAITEVVIPELISSRGGLDELRLWSAGCARGEEAITLAIVMTELQPLRGCRWTVLGTDVDESALDEARNGEYGERVMSRVPPAITNRHFVREGDRFRARPHILERVTYRRLNLVEQPLRLPPHSLDIVLLRNVLIYFSPANQRLVVESVANALARDGSLFLGPSESLRTVSTPLVSRHFEDCYCYRWPPEQSAAVTPTRDDPTMPAAAPPSAPTTVADVAVRLTEALDTGDQQGARELIDNAVERFPEDAYLRGFQGWILDRLGDLSAAVASYRAALYLEPSLVQVRFLIAGCLWRLGSRDRARHEFRAVLSALSVGRALAVEGFERLGVPPVADLGERCRRALEGEPTS